MIPQGERLLARCLLENHLADACKRAGTSSTNRKPKSFPSNGSARRPDADMASLGLSSLCPAKPALVYQHGLSESSLSGVWFQQGIVS